MQRSFLSDLKIIDLSTLLPGPFCTQILADFGAEVIKVESLTGDFLRNLENLGGKNNSYFSSLNRNKKSISLNLKSKEGKEILLKLIQNADVLVESFRPEVMKRLGLNYSKLKKQNKKLIYCALTGFGQYGEFKNKPGHDLTYNALCGLLSLTFGNKVTFPEVQSGDILTAQYAVIGILMAIIECRRSGHGSFIDISIFDTLFAGVPFQMADILSGIDPSLGVLQGGYACYNLYRTKDNKFLALGAIEKKFWINFLNIINKESFIDLQFAIEEQPKMIQELGRIFNSENQTEWLLIFENVETCIEKVNTLQESLNLDHLKSRNLLIQRGQNKYVASPIKFLQYNMNKFIKPPKLGENTRQILNELGYDKYDITELKKHGIIY